MVTHKFLERSLKQWKGKRSRDGHFPQRPRATGWAKRGLTLAVLSLEAVINMVMSREVWMSLICLVCSLTFVSCSPDWDQTQQN